MGSRKTGKQLLRWLLLVLALFILYVAGLLIHGTLTDFQPEDRITLKPLQSASKTIIPDSILSFVTWNVGYGGLGEESDFFYDGGNMFLSGGKMIRSPLPSVEKNVKGAETFLNTTQADFFLFQEVDAQSRRSYYTDQVELFARQLPGYSAWFAENYRVDRVPVPILEPWRAYGKTRSGLATYARYQPKESMRIQLPGAFSWPTRIFQLDRCLALHRFNCANGKELVVINIHNSAYDEDGSLKRKQMAFLENLIKEEYELGHYVLVGGDWNLCPPFFPFDKFMPGKTQGYTQLNIEPDFVPADWVWAYDPTTPTNRKIKTPYAKGETFETLIDFFLLSPNLKVRKVRGIDQGFQYSDHQPVWVEIELR